MSIFERISERFLLRAGIVAMFGVLALLAGLSLVTQRHTTDLAQRTETTGSLAALYRDVDHWVQEEKSIERQYRLEGSSAVEATTTARPPASRRGSSRSPRATGHRRRRGGAPSCSGSSAANTTRTTRFSPASAAG